MKKGRQSNQKLFFEGCCEIHPDLGEETQWQLSLETSSKWLKNGFTKTYHVDSLGALHCVMAKERQTTSIKSQAENITRETEKDKWKNNSYSTQELPPHWSHSSDVRAAEMFHWKLWVMRFINKIWYERKLMPSALPLCRVSFARRYTPLSSHSSHSNAHFCVSILLSVNLLSFREVSVGFILGNVYSLCLKWQS